MGGEEWKTNCASQIEFLKDFDICGKRVQILRVVSWNVADNAGMDGNLKDDAIQKLLGLYNTEDKVRQVRKPTDSYFIWFLRH